MYRQLIALIALSICLALPASSNPEPTYRAYQFWTMGERADPHETIDFRVALRQQNIDLLEQNLLEVSDPSSPSYGKHWTIDEILDLISPSEIESDMVVTMLEMNGCFNVENHRDFIKASARVSDIEELFDVEMHVYNHVTKKDTSIIRSSTIYKIPLEYKKTIDMVVGISELPYSKTKPQGQKIRVSAPGAGPQSDPGLIIPQTLQAVYNIPTNYPNNANTSLGLIEFQDDQSYNKKDLAEFAKQTATPPITVDKIVGPYSGAAPDGESTLDVQYGGATAQTASIWFWTVKGWMYEFSTDLFSTTPAPFVVSMSWGWPENLQCQSGVANCPNGESSEQYVQRVNVEFMKIGLRGISMLAASGDQGAPGDGSPGCNNKDAPLSNIFPGASPYVTSVGATMLAAPSAADKARAASAAQPPICSTQKCATSTTELVCTFPQALITTGGGFSTYSPVPSWQAKQVAAYLKSGVALPPTQYFNVSNRAFPDVSGLGHNYAIILSGSVIPVDGTSCSSPVVAGMVALLNSYRFQNNKPSLGFLNPLLYSAPSSVYNDITTGNNKCTESCCSKYGFLAAAGFDPVTGLGSIHFENMLGYVKTLN